MTRSGPGLISGSKLLSGLESKLLVSPPQGPDLIPVEGDRGSGHFHREWESD